MNRALILLLIAVATSLQAKIAAISIPEQDWKISIDAPALLVLEENQTSGGPTFAANSGNFNITVFVEEPQIKAGGSKECYQYYWNKSLQNPLINRDSVKISLLKSFYRVEYLVEVPDAKGTFKQKNINYFAAHKDRWIDVHISIANPSAADEAVFAAFDKGLKIEQAAASASLPGGTTTTASGLQVLRLSNTDALNFSLSPNWKMLPVVRPSEKFPFMTFPLRPQNGANASVLITVFAKYKERGKIDDAFLRKLIIGDCAPMIASSADKKMAEIHSILFTHGRGLYANFVDANLIGKPPVKDDFKISTCFMLCLEDQFLVKITVLCDNLSSGEYRDAVAMIKSLAEAK